MFDPRRRDRVYVLLLAIFISLTLGSCFAKKPPEPEPLPPTVQPARIAVVLGAGASKGFAHIGVLKVLEGQNIPIHMVVGTSAGSIVGSLYASGKNAFEIQEIAMKMDKENVIDYNWRVWSGGLIKGDKLESFINLNVNSTPIEKLARPFYAVATDIATGEEVVFGKGDTGMAVRASCSVPAVFQPMKIGPNVFVDGGVVSPVAVDVARRYGADIVIAVDISGGLKKEVPDGIMNNLKKSVDIMYSRIAEYQIKNADVVIRPDMKDIGSTDIEKLNFAILEGEKAATQKIPELQALMARLREEGRLAEDSPVR